MPKTYEITSVQNDLFKIFSECLGSKGVAKHRQALIFGPKAIGETILKNADKCIGIIVEQNSTAAIPPKLQELTRYYLGRDLFKQIDVFGSHGPILVVSTPEMRRWERNNPVTGCTLLIPFQEPSNVGAVLRSAAAFNVRAVLLARGTPHPFHPKSSRAASGTLFFHQFYRTGDLSELYFGKTPTIALDADGEDVRGFNFPDDFILIPGVEGPGLPGGFAPTHRVSISTHSDVESLNAHVATAIALYEWSSKLSKK